nr:uncharacterized protein LOC109771803 isoform X2 [Aegilops tauschii subsp. strangulata]
MEHHLRCAYSPSLLEGSGPAPAPAPPLWRGILGRCDYVRTGLGLNEDIGKKLTFSEGAFCKLCTQIAPPESGTSIFHPVVQIRFFYFFISRSHSIVVVGLILQCKEFSVSLLAMVPSKRKSSPLAWVPVVIVISPSLFSCAAGLDAAAPVALDAPPHLRVPPPPPPIMQAEQPQVDAVRLPDLTSLNRLQRGEDFGVRTGGCGQSSSSSWPPEALMKSYRSTILHLVPEEKRLSIYKSDVRQSQTKFRTHDCRSSFRRSVLEEKKWSTMHTCVEQIVGRSCARSFEESAPQTTIWPSMAYTANPAITFFGHTVIDGYTETMSNQVNQ